MCELKKMMITIDQIGNKNLEDPDFAKVSQIKQTDQRFTEVNKSHITPESEGNFEPPPFFVEQWAAGILQVVAQDPVLSHASESLVST